MGKRLLLALVFMGSIALLNTITLAQLAQPSFVKVSVSVPSTIAVHQTFELKANILIAPPYHIQANPPASGYIPTVLSVKPNAGLHVEKIVYPPSKTILFAGQKIPVYEGKATIVVKIRADRPGAFVVPMVLRYQGCNERNCYPPKEMPIKAKIIVGAKKVS